MRSRGVMERCSFCVQRIRAGRSPWNAGAWSRLTGERIPYAGATPSQGRYLNYQRMKDGNFLPGLRPGLPTNALMFGEQSDPTGPVYQYFEKANEQYDKVHHGEYVDESKTRVYRLWKKWPPSPT